jgi:hypothetical protein
METTREKNRRGKSLEGGLDRGGKCWGTKWNSHSLLRRALVATDDEEREEHGEQAAIDDEGVAGLSQDCQNETKSNVVRPVLLDEGQSAVQLVACKAKEIDESSKIHVSNRYKP